MPEMYVQPEGPHDPGDGVPRARGPVAGRPGSERLAGELRREDPVALLDRHPVS